MNGSFTVAELERQFGIPGVARVSEGSGGLARVQITGAFGEGEMYLHGAHVTSWKSAGNDEVLFISTKSRGRKATQSEVESRFVFPGFVASWTTRTLLRMDSSVQKCGSSSPSLKMKTELP